jgi:DNA invertase Pin-like site-specific DNA recombinase
MISDKKVFRCAIYTRKSSEEGLEQDFNSLEAQREACEAYIRSQEHEGWRLVPDQLNDGGFSGGNMDRPGLKQLIGLVEQGKIDVIVIYKIDRLTRSLTDFAKLAEVLDRHGVSFVSVTQQFNTTTSMGRLMLNVLLSFAQFEREITGERIRDKIAASKKKGMWMGGVPPMGYDVVDKRLVVNEADAATIRRVFALYLEEGTVPALIDRLKREDIRTAARYSAKGKHYGNRHFTRGHLYKLLTSPIYIGRVPHKTTSHGGQHEGIIDKATWDAVQAQLTVNTQGMRHRRRRVDRQPDLLEGKLFTPAGAPFTVGGARKGTRRYRYYVERREGAGKEPPLMRLPVSEVDAAVIAGLKAILADNRGLVAHLQLAPRETGVTINAANGLVAELDTGSPPPLVREKLRWLLQRVTVGADRLILTLSLPGTRQALGLPCGATDNPSNHGQEAWTITVPFDAARHGRQLKLVVPGSSGASAPDRSLVTAVVRAWDWAERLKNGDVDSMSEICQQEGFTDTYVGQVIQLAFLAPSIVEDILAGRQPPTVTANLLIWSTVPAHW